MSLTDPTSGAGYAFGERLTSAHMTTIATQQPDALDAVGGGAWTLGANATVAGAGEMRLNHLRLSSGGSSDVDHALAITDGVAVTWAGATNWPRVGSRVVTQLVPQTVIGNESAYWSFGFNELVWYQSNITDAGHIILPLPLVPGARLDAVTFYLDGNLKGAGAHAAFPANLPDFELWRMGDASYTKTSWDQKTPTAAGAWNGGVDIDGFGSTIANYDGLWQVVLDAGTLPQTLTAANQLYVSITGESGANSQIGLTLIAIAASWTVTEIQTG